MISKGKKIADFVINFNQLALDRFWDLNESENWTDYVKLKLTSWKKCVALVRLPIFYSNIYVWKLDGTQWPPVQLILFEKNSKSEHTKPNNEPNILFKTIDYSIDGLAISKWSAV